MTNPETEQKIDLRTLSPEARFKLIKEQFEIENMRRFGPHEERVRKNQAHVEQMVAKYSEPIIRQILKVMSQVTDAHEQPVFAKILSGHDIEHDDLCEMIRDHFPGGPYIQIRSHSGNEYHLSVSGGSGNAQEFWSLTIWKLGTRWSVKSSSFWIT